MGGSPRYSMSGGSHSTVLHMHSGNGDMGDLGRRFVECFVLVADNARLPDDPEFRAAPRAYMQGAVDEVGVLLAPGCGSSEGPAPAALVLGRPAQWINTHLSRCDA